MDSKSKIRIGSELVLVFILGVIVFKFYQSRQDSRAEDEKSTTQEQLKGPSKFFRDKGAAESAKGRVFGKESSVTGSNRIEESAPEIKTPEDAEFVEPGFLVAIIRDGQGQPYAGQAEIISEACNVKSIMTDGKIALQLEPGTCEFYVKSLADPSLVSQSVSVTVQSGETLSSIFNFPVEILSSVGLILAAGEAWQEVVEIIDGGPAALAGLQAGDIIIEIAGVDVSTSSANVAMGLLSGAANTSVEVVVAVEGDAGWEGIPVLLTREANY